MKNRLTAFVCLGIFGIILFWFLHKPAMQPTITTESILTNESVTASLPPVTTAVNAPRGPDPQTNPTAYTQYRIQQMDKAGQQSSNDWQTPIEFYGSVVDESNNVVSAADVDFQCNDLSADGTSYYHTESDPNGMFSIKDINGKLLRVTVNKQGYYSYEPNGAFFDYAGANHNFVPDQGKPVIFRLRKKGAGAALFHFHKNFPVPKDGTPIQIDLATGNLSQPGPNSIKVECWTYDTVKKQGWKFDWKCRVSVTGGGLQTNTDQFPFSAPDENYVPDDTIDMSVVESSPWAQDVQRNYYIRTADGKFARLAFRMIAHGEHFCQIDSFFNPTGSQNLEPQ